MAVMRMKGTNVGKVVKVTRYLIHISYSLSAMVNGVGW
jgi:hypothetical protein